MTRDEATKLIMSFPGVEPGTSYGLPSFKVRGKFLTRLRDEDDSLVVSDVPFDEREMLMAAEPQTFHLTDHYRNYETVLVRIATADRGSLRNLLARRWRRLAPKAAVAEFDAAARDTGAPAP